MTTFDTDPDTQTVAAAWASSELGQPDLHTHYGFPPGPTTDADAMRPMRKHAVLSVALACGIGAGAAVGLTIFKFDPDRSTVVVPGVGTNPTTEVAPNQQPPWPSAPAPTSVAPTHRSTTPDVATPPASGHGGAPIVVSAPSGPQPQNPAPQNPASQDPPAQQDEDPAPQPPEADPPPPAEDPQPPQDDPDPKPPVVIDPKFKLPDPPKPDPVPPVVVPDLPLAQPKP